jgi:hypothetical protein
MAGVAHGQLRRRLRWIGIGIGQEAVYDAVDRLRRGALALARYSRKS